MIIHCKITVRGGRYTDETHASSVTYRESDKDEDVSDLIGFAVYECVKERSNSPLSSVARAVVESLEDTDISREEDWSEAEKSFYDAACSVLQKYKPKK